MMTTHKAASGAKAPSRNRGARPRPDGFARGFQDGYYKGYQDGYGQGFKQGYERSTPFSGTSIIIPTYNQQTYLQKCIDSIRQYTAEPHEIIVVDNASQDDTAHYLQTEAGSVRYALNPSNLGFAGAVNQGLRMARGDTLLILNNDTVVTERWLTNLLACVRSNPKAGFVGPVTNYISGEQLIPTAYDSIESMHEFARSYNQSDPARWNKTGRITGFCILMRRDTFNKLGYLDEGFEIGNCEDDDYALRVQLLGLELIIAADTFIHHYGSVSMKSLGTDFDQVYGKNLTFYSEKWEDPHSLLTEAAPFQAGAERSVDYYPTHVLVHNAAGQYFWVEHGMRYPVADPIHLAATRLSEIDLQHWSMGEPISGSEAARKTEALTAYAGSGQVEGLLARTPDGHCYQMDSGVWRRLVSSKALAAWNPGGRPVHPISFELKDAYPQGRPIIAPPVIRSLNL